MTEFKFLDSINSIKLIPTLYLFMILYFFSIDIITAKYLGYAAKDIFLLIDIQKVIYTTSIMLLFFSIIGLIVRKSLIASIAVVFMFTILYAPNFNFNFEDAFKVVGAVFMLVVILTYDLGNKFIEYFDDNELKGNGIRIFVSLFLSLIIYLQIDNNIKNWQGFKFNNVNSKVQLKKSITTNIIFETKSLNPIYLQSLNQSLKVFASQNILNKISEQIFEKKANTKKFLLVPSDNFQFKKYSITVNYYDVGDIRNIFIINPATCNTNECELHTLIVKRRNKNDVTKGYNLISIYTKKVLLDVAPIPRPKFLDR